jgi:hypothetical protein
VREGPRNGDAPERQAPPLEEGAEREAPPHRNAVERQAPPNGEAAERQAPPNGGQRSVLARWTRDRPDHRKQEAGELYDAYAVEQMVREQLYGSRARQR